MRNRDHEDWELFEAAVRAMVAAGWLEVQRQDGQLVLCLTPKYDALEAAVGIDEACRILNSAGETLQ